MDLTETEYKVAGFVACGFSEKEIADKMYVSPKTVHNHTYNIRKKIKARNAVDIAREFILSLDNPKKFFAAVMFLFIQLFMVFDSVDVEMRKAKSRTTRVVRVVRSKPSRRNNLC